MSDASMRGPLARFSQWFDSLAARERRLILLAAGVVALAGLIWFAEWLISSRAHLQQALPAAQARLQAMQDDAAELAQLGRAALPAALPPAALADALRAAASARGLVLQVQGGAAGGALQVSGRGASAALLDWIATLHAELRLRPLRTEIEMLEDGQLRFELVLQP